MLEWFEVDTECLTPEAQAAYATIKGQTGLACGQAAREDHHEILNALLANADVSALGLRELFPHRFGGPARGPVPWEDNENEEDQFYPVIDCSGPEMPVLPMKMSLWSPVEVAMVTVLVGSTIEREPS
jgi:hypothetical protein